MVVCASSFRVRFQWQCWLQAQLCPTPLPISCLSCRAGSRTSLQQLLSCKEKKVSHSVSLIFINKRPNLGNGTRFVKGPMAVIFSVVWVYVQQVHVLQNQFSAVVYILLNAYFRCSQYNFYFQSFNVLSASEISFLVILAF